MVMRIYGVLKISCDLSSKYTLYTTKKSKKTISMAIDLDTKWVRA